MSYTPVLLLSPANLISTMSGLESRSLGSQSRVYFTGIPLLSNKIPAMTQTWLGSRCVRIDQNLKNLLQKVPAVIV